MTKALQAHSHQYDEPSSISTRVDDNYGSVGLCSNFEDFIVKNFSKDISMCKDHIHSISFSTPHDENSIVSRTARFGDLKCSKWAIQTTEPKLDAGTTFPSRSLESKVYASISESKWSLPPHQQGDKDVGNSVIRVIEAGRKLKRVGNTDNPTLTPTSPKLKVVDKVVLDEQGQAIAKLGNSDMLVQNRERNTTISNADTVECEHGYHEGRRVVRFVNDKRKSRYSREFLMSFRHMSIPPHSIARITATIQEGTQKTSDDSFGRTAPTRISMRQSSSNIIVGAEKSSTNTLRRSNTHRSANTSSGGLGQVNITLILHV
ncbi:hypothetical protein BGZ46_000922 [Entomortierella lignicola]|nr:hypothetical protein BGZ46_000922 [Entomortierella lignicola]